MMSVTIDFTTPTIIQTQRLATETEKESGMRPFTQSLRWLVATSCVMALSAATAGEGIVRMTDAGEQAGVVRLGGQPSRVQQSQLKAKRVNYTAVYAASPMAAQGPWQTAGYSMYGAFPQGAYSPVGMPGVACGPGGQCGTAMCGPQMCGPQMYCGPGVMCGPMMSCDPMCCPMDNCQACDLGSCGDCTSEGCNSCSCGGGCPGSACCCGCNSGGSCDDCFYGPGHNSRMLTVFAKATPKGSRCGGGGRYPKRWWRGQQLSYLARNQRLSNILFGWMIPSGCCGQGCPPVGKYQITYADQSGGCQTGGCQYGCGPMGGGMPGSGHPQDSIAYGAQGFGVPVTVPLPPNVRQSYNYSWGLPASRVTPTGTCTTAATPQGLYRQTW